MRNVSTECKPSFGEALAFYTVSGELDAEPEVLVVYRPIINLQQVLLRWQGTWAEEIATARALSIEAVVGIWEGIRTKKVHILRKHPGMDLLTSTERGDESEEDLIERDNFTTEYDD